MAFTDAPVDTNLTYEDFRRAFPPSLGAKGKGYLVAWGSDGTNKDMLKSSIVSELLKSLLGMSSKRREMSSIRSRSFKHRNMPHIHQ